MPRPHTAAELWDMANRRGLAEGPRPAERMRRPRNNEESLMQRAVIKWWRMACRGFGVPEILLLSIPNGGGRSGPIVGSIMKAEGLRKGAPDLMLALARNNREVPWLTPLGGETTKRMWHHGLFLELKTPTGRLQPEQEVFHDMLRQQSYAVHVCRSLEECVKVITHYLTE